MKSLGRMSILYAVILVAVTAAPALAQYPYRGYQPTFRYRTGRTRSSYSRPSYTHQRRIQRLRRRAFDRSYGGNRNGEQITGFDTRGNFYFGNRTHNGSTMYDLNGNYYYFQGR